MIYLDYSLRLFLTHTHTHTHTHQDGSVSAVCRSGDRTKYSVAHYIFHTVGCCVCTEYLLNCHVILTQNTDFMVTDQRVWLYSELRRSRQQHVQTVTRSGMCEWYLLVLYRVADMLCLRGRFEMITSRSLWFLSSLSSILTDLHIKQCHCMCDKHKHHKSTFIICRFYA